MTEHHHRFPTRLWGLSALATLSVLMACSSPPPAEQPDAVQASERAATPAQPDQRTQLKQALADTGVTVTDTPEGLIKISIPADSSFGLGRSTVTPAFAQLLDAMAEVFNRFPTTAIEITGHTDSTGPDALNLRISQQRAESTRDYLGTRQVDIGRIRTHGWGSDQPVADNGTLQGRIANRRVDIYLTE